jgi:hypothetical protein
MDSRESGALSCRARDVPYSTCVGSSLIWRSDAKKSMSIRVVPTLELLNTLFVLVVLALHFLQNRHLAAPQGQVGPKVFV